MILRGNFGCFWFHPTIPAIMTMLLLLLNGEQLRHKFHAIPLHVPSPLPLKTGGMFHTTDLTCHWFLKRFFISHHWKFCIHHIFWHMISGGTTWTLPIFNPLNAELNPICYLLALLGAHHFLHVSRIRVKSLTIRLLMSYIYGAPILDVSRSRTTTHHSR